jgi:hypothetical protein
MLRLLRRLQYWIGQRHAEADVREELDFHRRSMERDFERAGQTPQEAAYAAARAMGSLAQAREDARAVWIWPWCQSVWQDAAYATRILRRQPAFAVVPLAALATAIGFSVSLFTVFNTVVLKPWPVKDPSRVVAVFAGGPEGVGGFSLAEYRYVSDRAKSFAGLAVRSSVIARLGDEPVGQSTRGLAVSGNFFDVLGVDMARGRAFHPDEDRLDIPRAGLLSPRLSVSGLLLAIQVAVSVCLLVGAALLARSIWQAQAQGVEFAINDTSVVSFEFPISESDQPRLQAFFTQLSNDLSDARISPVGLASQVPLSGSHHLAAVRFTGEDLNHQRLIALENVSSGYCDVLRIPIVGGRTFDPADFDRHVVLVNQSVAHQYWPGKNPIGQTLFLGSESQEVVGVVKNVHTASLDRIEPTIYRPFSADPSAVLLIGAAPSLASAVATLVPRIDSRVRIQVAPLADNFARSLAPARAGAILAGVLGVFALLLATIGMWGVFGYAVQQRTREIGIRIALGATPSQVIRLVLADHSRALLVGLMVGFVGAAAGARLLQSYLYGVGSLDPAAFGLVSAVLAVAAWAATYGPARQASHVDPAITLRTQ